jgi:hypothetical protein
VGLTLVLEVKTIRHFFNSDCLLVSIVLQDELFEEQESTFVVHSLSELNLSHPGMRSPLLLAIITLQVSHFEFHYEGLLHQSA